MNEICIAVYFCGFLEGFKVYIVEGSKDMYIRVLGKRKFILTI